MLLAVLARTCDSMIVDEARNGLVAWVSVAGVVNGWIPACACACPCVCVCACVSLCVSMELKDDDICIIKGSACV